MNKIKVNFKKLKENAILPTFGTEYSAGADLYACIPSSIVIMPHQTVLIGTGFAMEVPIGCAGLVYARSGLASKNGCAPANKVGVIDCDYRGEVKVALHNHSDEPTEIRPLERVAQLVITPYLPFEVNEVDELSKTVRGEGGFGSTGK